MQYQIRQPATSAKENTPASWDLPLNLQICLKCEALNSKTATHCHKCGHPLLSVMKYSFHLYEKAAKAKVGDNWGLPLNLQTCSECAALNSKTASVCTKCGHSLQAPEAATGAIATSTTTATAASDDNKQEIPDMHDSAPAIAAAAAVASAKTAFAADRPALPVSNPPSSSDIPIKRKLRPLGWLTVLALAIAGMAFFLSPSSFRPPSVIPPAHAPDKKIAPPMPTASPRALEPVAVEKQTRINQATGEPAASGAPASTSAAQKTPDAITDSQCSAAAQALSLCNVNELQRR